MSASVAPARAVLRRVIGPLAFVGLAYVFAGIPGAVAGAIAVVARSLLGWGPDAFWAAAALAMVAVPFAIIAQGLPSTPVVGSQFGEHHLIAHVIVEVSLTLAAYAALLEVARLRSPNPAPHPPIATRIRHAFRVRPAWRRVTEGTREDGDRVAAEADRADPEPRPR